MYIKTQRAFTLIELLVVVAIISLLTSVTLSALGDARQKGTDSAKIQALQQVRSALQLYVTDKGYYPSMVTGLVTALVPKYIGAVDANIKYQSTDVFGIACALSNCPSYHLAVVLVRSDNKVLASDKDAFADGVIDGRGSNCVTSSGSDLCYDVTP